MPTGLDQEPHSESLPPDENLFLSSVQKVRSLETVEAHLANERTFLVWSGIAFLIIGGGVALARAVIALNTNMLTPSLFGAQPGNLKPTTLGLTFLVAGLVVLMLAACRYLTVQQQIVENRYRPSSLLPLLFLGIVLGLCFVLGWYLLQLRGTL